MAECTNGVVQNLHLVGSGNHENCEFHLLHSEGSEPSPQQLVPQLIARVQGTVRRLLCIDIRSVILCQLQIIFPSPQTIRSVAAVGAGGFHSALLTKRSDDGFDLIRSFESRKPVGLVDLMMLW